MTLKLKWYPLNQQTKDLVPPPRPAKEFLPQWYKDLPPYRSGYKAQYDFETNRVNTTAKACMPFFDSLVAGYIQHTWCDILVSYNKFGQVEISGTGPAHDIVTMRSPADYEYNPPKPGDEFHDEFNWRTRWEPKTPKGWSTLYMHPLNRYELPFLSSSGIIDTDLWWQTGNVPFYLKKDFEGIIPTGTPMYQMVFFKRENWKSEVMMDYTEAEQIKDDYVVRKYAGFGYKKAIWQKKNYD